MFKQVRNRHQQLRLLLTLLLIVTTPVMVWAQEDNNNGTVVYLPMIITDQAGVTPPPPPDVHPATLCGNDDRIAFTDRRVGRIGYRSGGAEVAACTVWLGANGALLTAGHCQPHLTMANAFVEFNIPVSDNNNGAINRANASDRYTVTQNSIIPSNISGNDWAIFGVQPNLLTRLTPFQAQNEFFRFTTRTPNTSATIRITGHGTDTGSANQTTQTHTGTYTTSVNIGRHRYQVDTMVENSGSPIIWDNNGFTIGIHTNGGCTATGGANSGTAFANTQLANALQNFHGTGTIHVDQVQFPGETENGTVFQPFNTVEEGLLTVNTVVQRVSIVAGTYNESFDSNKAVTLIAPAGAVTLRGEITIGEP